MFHAFRPTQTFHVDDLPKGNPVREHGNNVANIFTYIVNGLKEPNSFPNSEINELLNLTWWLVNQKVVLTGMDVNISTMNFGCDKECSQGVFILPVDWAEQCALDRLYCTGGLVWAASQCRDFYNKRMYMTDPTVIDRAQGYEAEFYLTMQNHEALKDKKIEFNDYQKQILEGYPKGLESIRHLLYTRKDFRGHAS